MSSWLVVDNMDYEMVRKHTTRIGFYNTAFHGQYMINGTYKHENVMRWSSCQCVNELFDLEKLVIPVNIP